MHISRYTQNTICKIVIVILIVWFIVAVGVAVKREYQAAQTAVQEFAAHNYQVTNFTVDRYGTFTYLYECQDCGRVFISEVPPECNN